MEPTLSEGDHLLVGHIWHYRVGDIVALRDPRNLQRVIVKRVVAVRREEVLLRGDNIETSTDSREFGPVPMKALMGKVLRRYWPPDRSGRPV